MDHLARLYQREGVRIGMLRTSSHELRSGSEDGPHHSRQIAMSLVAADVRFRDGGPEALWLAFAFTAIWSPATESKIARTRDGP